MSDGMVYLFPGQGAQKPGMGEGLFERYPSWVARADHLLGRSVQELCLEDPEGLLGQTQWTQPALFVVCALAHLDAVEHFGKPAFVAGHSLGEYTALFAAGAFDFETGLRLVRRRGELMSRVRGGAMAALKGPGPDEIADILRQHGFHSVDVANHNTPEQTVISGLEAEIHAAKSVFKDLGARYLVLDVSGAFHSRHMRAVKDELATELNRVNFRPLEIPVISNVEARPYTEERAAELLASQLTSPVRWADSIRYLLDQGQEDFREIGPGKALASMVKAVRARYTPKPVQQTPPPASAPAVAPIPVAAAAASNGNGFQLAPSSLGSAAFCRRYGTRYAYAAGAMYKGIASKELVIRMGQAGLLSFLGTGGMSLEEVEDAIREIQITLGPGRPYGMNLLSNPATPELERRTVELYLQHGVRTVEAAAFLQMTPALVHYRLRGARRQPSGAVEAPNRVIGKLSRPEVAEEFLAPAPEKLVRQLVNSGHLTPEEAACAPHLPMAGDLCVEADSAGHTDMGVASALIPTMVLLRDRAMERYRYAQRIGIGSSGGIGTPQAAASAFVLGADFIVTGSINQCTVEAGISDAVKDMLMAMNVQDTAYAPAGDMFEIGARIQVLKKGLFFPARANRLYELYRQHGSLEELDEKTRRQIEEKYFQRSFEQVWAETREYYAKAAPDQLELAERHPKHKMALIFRWYFIHSMRLALSGDESQRRDYQVHCGPALGAFNQWVRGTELEDWRSRHVDQIAERLMQGTAEVLSSWIGERITGR